MTQADPAKKESLKKLLARKAAEGLKGGVEASSAALSLATGPKRSIFAKPKDTATPTAGGPTKSAGLGMRSNADDDQGSYEKHKTKTPEPAEDATSVRSREYGYGTTKVDYNTTEGSVKERGGERGLLAQDRRGFLEKVGDEKGRHAEANGDARAVAATNAKAKASSGKLSDIDPNAVGLFGAAEAEAVARLEAQAKLEGKLAYGDFAEFAASAEGQVWLQAKARAAASGSIGTEGVAAAADLYLGAEAGTSLAVELEIDIGELGLEGDLEFELRAAAEVGATGVFSLDTGGVMVGGEAFLFAGVEVTAEGTARGKMYDRPVLSLTGNAGAHLGYKFGGGGMFQMRGGKLVVSFEVAATAHLPAGVTLGTGLEFDSKPVAVALARGLSDLKWNLAMEDPQAALDDISGGQAKLTQKLQEYSDFKRKQLAKQRADNYVKIEKVQMFVKEVFPINNLSKDMTDRYVVGVDKAITQAILETLVPEKGKTLKVTVERGRVRKIENLVEVKSGATKRDIESMFDFETDAGVFSVG